MVMVAHVCVLRDLDDIQPDSERMVKTGFGSGRVHLVLAKITGSDDLVLVSIKYPKHAWTEDRASFACAARSGVFEAAIEEDDPKDLEETFEEDIFFSEEQIAKLLMGHGMSEQELDRARAVITIPAELAGAVNGNFIHLGQQLLGVEERDGLIWKQLLITGSWPGNEFVPAIVITDMMLSDIKEAFDADVIPHVDVPDGHTNSTLANTGFVREVEIRTVDDKQSLWVGIEFTESFVKDKVLHGTIANVSAGLEKGFTDPTTGDKWPWVLWHVALTNKPVLKDLQPFVTASLDGLNIQVYKEAEMADKDDKDGKKGTGEEKTPSAKSGNQNGTVTMSQDELDKIKKDVAATARAESTQENETAITELRSRAEANERLAQESARKLHTNDVSSIIAALSGRGEHPEVSISQGMAFAPVIVKVVQPYLEADFGGTSVLKLSLDDGKEIEYSVTDIVLSILNSFADAFSDAMIELNVSKGSQEHKPPGSGSETTDEDKDKEVDSYLERRGLSLVTATEE